MSSKVVKLTEDVFVVPGRTNVGIIKLDGGECVVVDTGLDEDYGRRVYNTLRGLGLRLRAILNTHSHADHIGGNEILVRRFNANVYSSRYEVPFIELPLLEAIYLYGSMPPDSFKSKLLVAEGVKARDVSEVRGDLGVGVLELPGHSLGMLGFSKDDVLFTADAFFSAEVLTKHVIPYHMNVSKARETLEKLSNTVLNYRFIVPSHGKVSSANEALSEIGENIRVIEGVKNTVLKALSEGPIQLEEVLDKTFRSLNIKVANAISYMLLRSAINSYISWLVDEGLAEIEVTNNKLLVRKV